MRPVDFTTVKASIALASVCGRLGIPLRAAQSPWWRGPCPRKCCRSSSVCGYHLGQGRWHCRRCDATGDVIDLWRIGQGFNDILGAARDLCEAFGVPIPYLPTYLPSRTEKRIGNAGGGDAPSPS